MRKQRKKQKERFWIHEVISKRSELGEYHRLIQELRHDPERFRRYFRMSKSQFDMLLWLIGSEIEKMDTNWSPSMSSTERLAITLRSVCTITWRNSSFWYLQRFHQTNANGDVLAGFDPLGIGLSWNAAQPIQTWSNSPKMLPGLAALRWVDGAGHITGSVPSVPSVTGQTRQFIVGARPVSVFCIPAKRGIDRPQNVLPSVMISTKWWNSLNCFLYFSLFSSFALS